MAYAPPSPPTDTAADLLSRVMTRDGALSTDRGLYLEILWEDNPRLKELLRSATTLEQARGLVLDHLDRVERRHCHEDSEVHLLELATIRDCITVLRNILMPLSERRVGSSTLEVLWRLARGEDRGMAVEAAPGFLLEVISLLRGVYGDLLLYDGDERAARLLALSGREAAELRSELLDDLSHDMNRHLARYPTGLEADVVKRRAANRDRILAALGGSRADWDDYRWHLKHVLKDSRHVRELIELDPEGIAAIDLLAHEHLPFGVTPFYLSLVDRDRFLGFDRSIRAQVLPPPAYARLLTDAKDQRGQHLDFMGEGDTSPVDLVTRRYPRIAILKPFNTCAQICVYCQRNWEIEQCMAPGAEAPADRLAQAIDWLAAHPEVGDVLVTGGDPAILPDKALERIFERLAALPHVYRIRLGTRTPVVLPQRWSGGLASKLARYHEPGRRELVVVTHFQHPYEIGPEALAAVQSLRRRGLSVYNQQVFTHYNSRRFESARLRLALRSIGVDPYYIFNMKGKEETADYRVPIPRLLQERKEEARLLPGLDRTDEPVFNVPRLGKNHLRLWQDHRLLGILPDGRRVTSFHPWEKYISLVEPYVFTDVAIFDYLQRLAGEGEDLREYWSIWYYF